MMNYANDIDVYQIWADMVCFDKGRFDPEHRPYCCVYASRRRNRQYANSHEDIYAAYGASIVMYEEMPEVLSGAMGNFAYIARFPTEAEAMAFAEFALKK
jgi:hypothetical protein